MVEVYGPDTKCNTFWWSWSSSFGEGLRSTHQVQYILVKLIFITWRRFTVQTPSAIHFGEADFHHMAEVYGPDTKCNTFWWSWSSSHGGGLRSRHQVQYILVKLIFITWRRFTVHTPSAIHFGEADLHHMAKVYGPDTKCNTFWWSWFSSHGEGLRSTHQVQYILVKLIFIIWRRFTVQTPSAIHFGEADLHHMAEVYGPDTKCNTFWWSWSSSFGGGLRSRHQVQYILVKLIFITWRRFTVQTPSAIHFGEADLHHMAKVYGPTPSAIHFGEADLHHMAKVYGPDTKCNTFWWSWSSSHGEGWRSRHQVQYILVKLIFITWRRFTVQTPSAIHFGEADLHHIAEVYGPDTKCNTFWWSWSSSFGGGLRSRHQVQYILVKLIFITWRRFTVQTPSAIHFGEADLHHMAKVYGPTPSAIHFGEADFHHMAEVYGPDTKCNTFWWSWSSSHGGGLRSTHQVQYILVKLIFITWRRFTVQTPSAIHFGEADLHHMAEVYGPDTKCNTFWWSWSSSHGEGLRSRHQVQYILVKLISITWRRFTVHTPSAIHFGEADLHHLAKVYGPDTKCNTFWWSWSSSYSGGLRSRHQVQYILVKLIFIIWRRFTVQTPSAIHFGEADLHHIAKVYGPDTKCNTFWWSWSSSHGEGLRSRHQVQYILVKLIFITWRRFTVQTPSAIHFGEADFHHMAEVYGPHTKCNTFWWSWSSSFGEGLRSRHQVQYILVKLIFII